MQKFDLIVIGAGSGLTIVDVAARLGLKVALVEEGPMGGTCLNRGCIPSKLLIHSADIAEQIRNAAKFGLQAKLTKVNFSKITSRVSRIVDADARHIESSIRASRNITLFKMRGTFVGKKQLKVGSKVITAPKIIIFAGTREMIPPVKGLDTVPYVTSKEALRLTTQPKRMVIVGGGFIAAELGHFYGALGTKVTIIQMNDLLVPRADLELAQAFTKVFSRKHEVLLRHVAASVKKSGKSIIVTAKHVKTGKTKRITCDSLLIAAGRRPNSDILDVAKTGVSVNKFGYIDTNEYLETKVPGIWAAGDIAGKWLFKHSANLEATYLVNNIFLHKKKEKVNYTAMPSAVFSSPQLASVGKSEQELAKGTYDVGRYEYKHTGMGQALQDEDGFVKILVDKKTKKILGCHIMGEQASTLIHEVIVAMRMTSGKIDALTTPVHIHPALPEVVQRAAFQISH